jgi:hypothetical protein
MSLQVCVDALIYWNGSVLDFRNDASISQDADVAEARPFVSSVANAYPTKAPTWKNWTCSLSGYYDDADNTVQNAIRDGTSAQIVIYPTRTNLTNYWYGTAFCNSCEAGMTSEDYGSMNAEFTGSANVTWINA